MKLSYKYLTVNVPVGFLMWLKGKMTYIKAAGGIVSIEDKEYLLIRRNNRWDLPKGRVEDGETLLGAAYREVFEETAAILQTENIKPLIKTYHIYRMFGKWHLKQTSWFVMTSSGDRKLKPQQEEGITEAVWVSREQFSERLKGSYGTMRTIVRRCKNIERG